jgi:hypothetical protein
MVERASSERIQLNKKENWQNGLVIEEITRRLKVDPEDPEFLDVFESFVETTVENATLEEGPFLSLFKNQWLRRRS